MERESASLEGKYIDFVYHGAVFERMNALADSEKAPSALDSWVS